MALSLGCSPDEVALCGDGDEVEASGQTVCVYRNEIIETGFDCPAERPHRHNMGDLVVCSGDEELPEGLPEELDERYPDNEIDPDAGNNGWDVDTYSPECREDSDCGGSEVCVRESCRDASNLQPCDGHWNCGRGELCEDGYCLEDPDYPPDTDAQRFEGTACDGRYAANANRDSRCYENEGCAELDVRCGECVCTLCADEYCLETVCDDGGSQECPGGPFVDAGHSDGG
ncbi:MAG: DUF7107 domain-containing protein [Myxococcota bacterium]